jgi:hypothetical protein
VSKRFPVPDFDRDLFKNLPWTEPSTLSPEEVSTLSDTSQQTEGSAIGAYPVAVSAELAGRFEFKMDGKSAVMCILPAKEVLMSGRSWAWPIQRALIIDSLDPGRATVLADWKTPRPMNTRLGPDKGIVLPARIVFVLCGHQYADHWIANRILVSNDEDGPVRGFSLLSASDDRINDFHSCNLTFSWD